MLEAVADPVRLHILRTLSAVPDATAAELAQRGLASNRTLRRHLEALVVYGVIDEREGESDGQTPGRPATRFSLSPEIENPRDGLHVALTRARDASMPMNGASAT